LAAEALRSAHRPVNALRLQRFTVGNKLRRPRRTPRPLSLNAANHCPDATFCVLAGNGILRPRRPARPCDGPWYETRERPCKPVGSPPLAGHPFGTGERGPKEFLPYAPFFFMTKNKQKFFRPTPLANPWVFFFSTPFGFIAGFQSVLKAKCKKGSPLSPASLGCGRARGAPPPS